MIKMKKQYFFLIIILFICQKTLGQQDNAYYQKGLETALDSLVQENSKFVYHLINEYTELDTSKDSFGGFECNINFDDLKQNNIDNTKIIIPEKFRSRMRKNNFINKIIYGRRLVAFNIDVLFKSSNHIVFRANFYGKEGGIFILIQFKNNSLEIDEFCKVYSIY